MVFRTAFRRVWTAFGLDFTYASTVLKVFIISMEFLAFRKHVHESRDSAGARLWLLGFQDAPGDGIRVGLAERRVERLGLLVLGEGLQEVGGRLHERGTGVRVSPAAVGLGALHFGQARRPHALLLDEPGDVAAVDLGPYALRAPRTETLRYCFSSRLSAWLSIQPQQRASSSASAYVTLG